MGTRLTDAELAAFVASVRIASDDPHQDFGDVGFVFEDLEDHLVLEELVAARKVIAAVRAAERKWLHLLWPGLPHLPHLRVPPACLHDEGRVLDVALAEYDRLFVNGPG